VVSTGKCIGVSIIQLIMFRRGGKVWAEGKEGERAIFYLSIN